MGRVFESTRVLVSLTTIPRRMDPALSALLDALCSSRHDVLLTIPYTYVKWGDPVIPAWLESRSDLIIHRSADDHGPATKLLGAMEWLAANPSRSYTHILTVDDDCYYPELDLAVAVLLTAGRAQRRPSVITFGGIRLIHPPYRHGDGLSYDNIGHVDVVAGFRGVLYPVEVLQHGREVFFALRDTLPAEIFHDDDAYFGMVLGRLDVPIWAVPTSIPEIGLSKKSMNVTEASENSGVAEGADTDRKTRESRLFTHAVAAGLLPNPSTPSPAMQRLAFGLIARLLATRAAR